MVKANESSIIEQMKARNENKNVQRILENCLDEIRGFKLRLDEVTSANELDETTASQVRQYNESFREQVANIVNLRNSLGITSNASQKAEIIEDTVGQLRETFYAFMSETILEQTEKLRTN